MTRLPWQHNRTRTKSGEKSHLGQPQEWFSRNTSEPSRQAFSELVKAHKREASDESNGPRSRSRGNTITSTEWQNRSRAGSTSDEAWSRPASPHYTKEDSIYSTLDRSEGTTKALLARGGLILRRTGSKMSLSSAGSSSTISTMNPQRNSIAPSNTIRAEQIRSNISAPFDFQHITHTEQTQFPGLSRIEESDLAHQFSNVVTRQSAAPGLRGITAADICVEESSETSVLPNTTSFSSASPLPMLPSTPDGPTPPPKDETTQGYTSVNLASPRTPRFPRSSPTSPSFGSSPQLPTIDTSLLPIDLSSAVVSMGSGISSTVDTHALEAKPLPQLPVIHAVTTADDTAREMRSVPLPTPPGVPSPAESNVSSKRPSHQRQKSSVALPRHFSLRPSTKTSMPNLLSANHLSIGAKTLPRHHSDMALSDQAKEASHTIQPRSSMSFAAIDTMNWEDAIDEAWDDADTDSLAMDDSQMLSFSDRKPSNSSLLNSFSSEVGISAVSTPLMMNAPTQPLPSIPTDKVSPRPSAEGHKLESVIEDEQQSDLAGLGISSCPPPSNPAGSHLSRSSSVHYPKRRSSLYTRQAETLTRSSSQESIILSIASSIIGTQRSSNSSLNPEDLMNSSKIDQEPLHYFAEDDNIAATRPESGCLPLDILEQMSKAGLATMPTPPLQNDYIPPVPPVPQHKSSKSASKITVPERRSSVATVDHSRTNRKRSNTTGTRPRQSARISYSLFPNATPIPSPSAVGS